MLDFQTKEKYLSTMYTSKYMVITYSRLWINRVRLPILLVVSWTGFSLLILHTQAESGAYSRDSSRVPRRRPFIYSNRHTPSGQSRVYRVTQLRTDGLHCRGSAGAGPVVLKVVPVTAAAILQVTMNPLCAPLFSHTHYRYEAAMLLEGYYSPEFIGSRNCVPMAFTAESSPAQGQ